MGKFLHEIQLFSKAQVSAQLGTATDFTMSLLLAEWIGVYYVVATFIGAVSGGAVNCLINYRWVFGSDGQHKRYVVLKYWLVWGISIMLNTAGTYLITELSGCHFILGRALTGIAVAVLWNYQMHKHFVFRNLHPTT